MIPNFLTQLTAATTVGTKAPPKKKRMPVNAGKTNAPEKYGRVMKGQGRMSAIQISTILGDTSRCAVRRALEDTLVKRGLVRRIDVHRGTQPTCEYEWIG